MSSFVEALLAATGALVYGLGVWALMVVDSTGGERLDLLPALYQGLRFFILDPYGMPSAGWSAGHIAFWCALFGAPALLAGKLIDLTRLLFVHAGHSFWPSGWFRTPPIVICGFGAHGRSIASACVQHGHRIIVVDTLDVSDGMGFVVVESKRFRFVRGDFTTSGVLRRAETQRASQVWFCAGDPNVNLRAAQAAAKLTNRRGNTARLIPMVDSDWEVGALSKWRETWPQIEPFIQFKQAALALVNRWQAGSAGSPPVTGVQRVAIIGFGRLGKAVLDELALRSLQSGMRTEVAVVDPGAKGKVALWKDRHQMPLLTVTGETCVADDYAWCGRSPSLHGFTLRLDDFEGKLISALAPCVQAG